jgi:hypothetical protein
MIYDPGETRLLQTGAGGDAIAAGTGGEGAALVAKKEVGKQPTPLGGCE